MSREKPRPRQSSEESPPEDFFDRYVSTEETPDNQSSELDRQIDAATAELGSAKYVEGSAEENIYTIKLKGLVALAKLRDEQDEKRFERQLKLIEKQGEINLEIQRRNDYELQESRWQELKEKEDKEKSFTDRISLFFKMAASITSIAFGAYLVIHGENLGYFLLGSGLGASGVNASELMEASRR